MVLKVKRLLKELESFGWFPDHSIGLLPVTFTSIVLIDIRLKEKAKEKWTPVAVEKWRHF